MRVAMAAVVLLVACGHKPSSEDRTLATIPVRGTPVWMGSASGQLLVAVAGDVDDRGPPLAALVTIDPKSGNARQLAGSLPAGAFDVEDGKLLLAAYIGEVG